MTFTASQSSLPPLPGTQAERLAYRRAVADVKALERARRYFEAERVPGVHPTRVPPVLRCLTAALNAATDVRDELDMQLHASAAAERGAQ